MNAFDKVIGYKATKRELLPLCDMLRNREIYEEMGARLPHGLLLYGDPGLGKTLLARCFVEESGLHAITVRRDKGGDAFIDGITQAFASAKTKAPSIVLLDDMDKFANEDDTHCDAPEYAAVQAGIDDVKDTGVFVIATANDIRKLPSSLRRSGRFDRKIGLQAPTASDAEEIITHYLKTKQVSDSVNMEDLTRMMRYNSCAELETILNEAAVRAAFARKTGIDMEDMVSVVLKQQYGAQEDMPRVSDEVIEKVALHEAGHLVVCEALCPGSVGFASLLPSDENRCGGFIHCCKGASDSQSAIIALGGKAAVETRYAGQVADGMQRRYRLCGQLYPRGGSQGGYAGILPAECRKRFLQRYVRKPECPQRGGGTGGAGAVLRQGKGAPCSKRGVSERDHRGAGHEEDPALFRYSGYLRHRCKEKPCGDLRGGFKV